MKELDKVLKICNKKIISYYEFKSLLNSDVVVGLSSLGQEGNLTNYRIDIVDPYDELKIGSKFIQLKSA